jgi:hypothetical protein
MILVLDADADTVRAVANAAICVNCNLRFIQTSKDFFCFCHKDFQNVAAIILDVDPGWRSWNALDACKKTRLLPVCLNFVAVKTGL